MEFTFNLAKIDEAARQFVAASADDQVFAFHGNLGAGKTTLIAAVCKVLGVREAVSSPTFSIINEYASANGNIYHIDLYRLSDEEAAVNAGVEECLYSGKLCFVEWPERAARLLPPATVHVFLQTIDPDTRRLKLEIPHAH